jgi:hypothetical protein
MMENASLQPVARTKARQYSAQHLSRTDHSGARGGRPRSGLRPALNGSLLVLAKEPLHLTPEQIRWLAAAPILFLVIGALTRFAAMHESEIARQRSPAFAPLSSIGVEQILYAQRIPGVTQREMRGAVRAALRDAFAPSSTNRV